MAAAMPERNMREWYTLSHELKLASERQIESLAWRPVLRHSRRLRRLILFIIIHICWFLIWILMPVEPFPYGLLTMIVSLEAIFLHDPSYL